jgi:type VI protein secretion system component Hcp
MGAAHYLRLLDKDGQPIQGESEGHGYERCIDIASWNWEVTDESVKKAAAPTGPAGVGTTAGAAKASAGSGEVGVAPSQFTFSKAVDASTTRLMTEMYKGRLLQSATFTLLEEMVDIKVKHREAFRLDVVLEGVKVVSYRLSGRSSEHRVDLEETWELSYEKVTFDFKSEGMNTEFGASRKEASEKPNAQVLESLKQLGITPGQQGVTPGKRG